MWGLGIDIFLSFSRNFNVQPGLRISMLEEVFFLGLLSKETNVLSVYHVLDTGWYLYVFLTYSNPVSGFLPLPFLIPLWIK